MNPYADDIETIWQQTQTSIDAYWTQPTTTAAYCETCGRKSTYNPCQSCTDYINQLDGGDDAE